MSYELARRTCWRFPEQCFGLACFADGSELDFQMFYVANDTDKHYSAACKGDSSIAELEQ